MQVVFECTDYLSDVTVPVDQVTECLHRPDHDGNAAVSEEELSVWPLECECFSFIRVGGNIKNAVSDIVAHADELIKAGMFHKNITMPIDKRLYPDWNHRDGGFR
ncbi:MAG TPA: hypothetical protein VHP36_03080 [Chitinispirillaceae bacterium]|nr:hypothetical protein [Chitinispirillaceae bacterium]